MKAPPVELIPYEVDAQRFNSGIWGSSCYYRDGEDIRGCLWVRLGFWVEECSCVEAGVASFPSRARGGHCCEMRELHNSISNFETMPHNWDVINLKGTGALRNVVEIFDQ